ncbi:MAG: Hsp20/alpha crystallin family protein [Lentisphaeria bacterium]|nr:Hsp20/alpha crystallin family protein [Lentisphaeria bacterium]NQZ67225.1 Hsp20/alpha crystallin family protein [Lentisphaeria bacterium]
MDQLTKCKTDSCSVETSQAVYKRRPNANVYETDDAVLLELEIPGVSEKDVNIKLEDGVMSIEAHVSADVPEAFKDSRNKVVYERSFRLRRDIDTDKITAEIKNGVLSLALYIAESAKPKKIKVKAG